MGDIGNERNWIEVLPERTPAERPAGPGEAGRSAPAT
jgi:hypothetical protein